MKILNQSATLVLMVNLGMLVSLFNLVTVPIELVVFIFSHF